MNLHTNTPENAAGKIAWEWLIAGLLSANLIWTSLCLGGVRAETQVWSSALTGVSLAVLLLRAWRDASARPHWAGWCVLPFLLYAAANVLWVTPVRWLGERDLWQWFQVFATFWIALNGLQQRRPRQLVLAAILLLGVAAVILSGWQLGGHRSWLMLGRAQAAQYAGRASGFFGNPNTLAAFFVLLIPPVLSRVWRRGSEGKGKGGSAQRVACGWLALVFAGAAVATLSRGGLIALTLALICWPLVVGEWRWRKRALVCVSGVLVAVIACSALWFASPAMRKRINELAADRGEKSRLILWQASLKMIASAPLHGTGAGSFNTVFEKYRPEGFRDEPQWTHNEYLNTLSDYGAVGFILLLGGAGMIAWRCRKARRRIAWHGLPARDVAAREPVRASKFQTHGLAARATTSQPPFSGSDKFVAEAGFTRGLGIGLLGLAFACMTDFHMKIPAIGMIAAVCLAEFVKRHYGVRDFSPAFDGGIHPAASSEEGGPMNWPVKSGTEVPHSIKGVTPRRVFLCACAVLLALLFHRAINAQLAEAARVAGREKIDALALRETTGNGTGNVPQAETLRVLTQVGALFERALGRDSANAQAWADRAYVLALQARALHASAADAAQIGLDAERAARAALARSAVVPEFWLRLGVALDLQGRADEAGEAFAQALRLAPSSALAWYHQAYHLSLAPATRGLAQGALDICLRLDPGYLNAENLRQQLGQNH